jgi:RHS repeat-associated protein
LSQNGLVQNPYGFSTKEYNSKSGLIYFGARYYDPRIGRFITKDPLGMVDGPNLYVYCGNNAVNFTDPWGLDYWIEGPSVGEPAGHQSINVGDPNGEYDSYSFGVNGNINLRNALEGEVYRDPIKGGTIDLDFYRETTPEEDKAIKAYLESLVGKKRPYTPWSTCRNFSQNEFTKLLDKGYGHKSQPPSRPNSTGRPSSQVPPLSSTVTSSEPYGIPSRSTKKGR